MAAFALIASLVLMAIPAHAVKARPQKIRFSTPDGTVVRALFCEPAKNKPTLVMLHGYKSVKEEWDPLVDVLWDKGWGTFAYDLPERQPRSKMVDDIGAVLAYLEKEKNIRREHVSLAGASLGANLVLAYASLTRHSGKMVLLSPSIDYQGVETRDLIKRVSSPILAVASQADPYAFESVSFFKKINPRVTVWTDVKAGHGVQMFDASFLDRLVRWLSAL